MKKIILETWTDHMCGELGFVLADMPRSDEVNSSLDAELIAHDIIEHVNGPKEIGGIADECEALGAIWMCRGQHGQIRRVGNAMRSPHQDIASDITRMFRDWFYNREYLPTKRVKAHGHDDDFNDIIQYARTEALDEFDDDEKDAARELLPDYLARVRSLMVIGARKLVRKYGDNYASNNLFYAIVDAVAPYMNAVDYEGQRFTLRYGFEKFGPAVAYMEENFSEDDY